LKKYILVIFLYLLTTGSIRSQPYYFKHYFTENGLSNSTIVCCLQDKKGFLWFGTQDGLNRFDGYTFKIYRNNSNDTKSLGSNLVHALYEDVDGTILVGSDRGIYSYNPANEYFTVLPFASSGEVLSLLKDKKGNLWYVSDQRIFEFVKRTGLLKSYAINNCKVTSVCLSPAGKIWISSSTGNIYSFNEKTDAFTGFNVFNHSKTSRTDWIVKLYCNNEQSIFIGTTNQGLKEFNTQTNTYRDVLSYNDDHTDIFVRDILCIKPDEYWIATESGIYVYNPSKNSVVNLKKQYDDPYSLSDNSVYCLLKDREENIWAGTYFGGVNFYSPQYALFHKYFPKYNSNSLSGNVVRRICGDMFGNLWIGTEDAGLNKLDPKTGAFTIFKPNGDKNSLSYNNIHGLLAIGDKLWIGTFEHGLDIMDIRTGKIIRHYETIDKEHALERNFIINIYQTRSKSIYIGAGNGLYRYNSLSDDFTFIHGGHVQAILEDDKGIIWAGTRQAGLYFYDPKTGQTRKFSDKSPAEENMTINDIFEDSDKHLWFTTENGLYELDRKKRRFIIYNTSNGLPVNVTLSMEEDQNKNLWVSTSGGLMSMNLVTRKINTYTKGNGLLNNQFNYDSAFKDANGVMYFGCVRGLVSFNPTAFNSKGLIFPVYITGFQVNNKELKIDDPDSPLKQSIIDTRIIKLQHDQASFSIDFAALSFSAPEISEYAYKMKGIDNDWTYLKTNRKVYFTDLSPGEYTFQVKAVNNKGIWNQWPTELIINIKPPFWASGIAYTGYAITFACILLLSVRIYHQRHLGKIKRRFEQFENEKEREIYEAKIEFFTHITHEIRTPLTLIKGPLENAIDKLTTTSAVYDDLKSVNKNTDRLLDLTNQLLDFRKTESKGYNLTFVNLNISNVLKNIYLDFKHLADQKGLLLQLTLPDEPVYADADADATYKILANLISNAVKYAGNKIMISLYIEKDYMVIKLNNDGFLIPAELKEKIFEPFFRVTETDKQQGNGIGLALCKSLAELHEGTLNLETNEAGLNSFKLCLPLKQKNVFTLHHETEENLEATSIPGTEPDPLKPLIMVVEDNKEIRTFLYEALRTEYAVITTGNGEEALGMLKHKSVQLILSDVIMPVMDGFTLCEKIKTDLDFSHIPIILLTAKNALQSKIAGLESGADAYIEKPFSPGHLRAQIANLLKNRSSIKAYFASSPLVNIKNIAYSKADEVFLEKLNALILQNLDRAELDVDQLADMMNMSRPTLYRKIKAISNLTPNELINLARLKKAAELLVTGEHKIYEVSTIAGFSSPSYFSHNFFKQFGMSPSDYAQNKRTEKKDLA
jgi:signal transduction histidine kinase/ligand-binding sensor domain-containing protein/DNA-binding response OmpR family regulator